MAFLTPGVAFLGRGLISLLFPCAVIAGIRLILAIQFDLVVPTWGVVIASILIIPLVLVARYQWVQFHHRRRAAALGARIAPRLQGKWPGNLDILLDAMDKLQNSYIGKFHRCNFTILVSDYAMRS